MNVFIDWFIEMARDPGYCDKDEITRSVTLKIKDIEQAVVSLDDRQSMLVLAQLLVLSRTMAYKMGIDAQHKMHEIIFAYQNNMEVRKEAHGADMTDSEGKAVDHKHMELSTAKQCNVNITFPAKVPNSTVDQFATATYEDVVRKGDVLVEADGSKAGLPNYSVRLPARFVAEYCRNFIKVKYGDLNVKGPKRMKAPTKVNLGAKACSVCKRVHRIDHFHRLALTSDYSTLSWNDIVRSKVCSTCK